MTIQPDFDLQDMPVSESWANSVTEELERSSRRAWIVAAVAALIALIEGIALILLTPLKTVEPYTLLVDKQTGHVERLAPLDAQIVRADDALTRSFLVQYVVARESYSAEAIQEDYRKVWLFSDPGVQRDYQAEIASRNLEGSGSYLASGASLQTEVKSISELEDERALVRFATSASRPGSIEEATQHWVSLIDFEFTTLGMSEADRYINPLGFQVTSYRKSAETLPEEGIINGVELPTEAVTQP